jgi:Phytanoyl-CoA dioxygenase (PhyH)
MIVSTSSAGAAASITTDEEGSTTAQQRDQKMIYTLSAEQRTALLSSDEKEFVAAFDTMLCDIQSTFDEEGLVLIRGLLEEEPLQRLCEAGQAVAATSVKSGITFESLKFGPIFCFPEANDKEVVNGQAFRDVAMRSAIPAFIARVIFRNQPLQQSPCDLRLLKDAFMAKGKEQDFCGWHVDDSGFWPTDAHSNGVNVWISLDEMPAQYGGGLAVSPRSHHAPWRHQAYQAIGSVKTFPPEGVELSSPRFDQIFGRTCAMETLDPTLNETIESSKVVFDYKRGDCLFCTRWLFHRSVRINEVGLKHYDNQACALKRYSVRYERGDAKLIRGVSVEAPVLLDKENAGKTLAEVCKACGPYYPQCWPMVDDPMKQEVEMKGLVIDTFPKVEAKLKAVMKEIGEKVAKAKTDTSNVKAGGY